MLHWWQTQSTTWGLWHQDRWKHYWQWWRIPHPGIEERDEIQEDGPAWNELYHHSKSVSSQQLPSTSSAKNYISSEQFKPQTRWYPSCPPHMIAWIQHSMGLRRSTSSLHQRGTPTQYLKSLLSTATVWNVGYKGVNALKTLNPAAHSADVKVAWLQNAKRLR